MAKRVRKSKELKQSSNRSFLITEVICSLIIVACVGISYFNYLRIQEYRKLEKKVNAEDKAVQKKLKDENASLTKVTEELDYYQNIDNSIKDIQTEYFQIIKSKEDAILNGTSDTKIAYLTFDDGPYYNTYRVFDILDQYGVKATFFTTNINGEYCFDNENANCWIRYQEYVDRGHTIANHTYTHGIFRGLYSSTDAFMDAVIKQEEHIKNLAGGYVTNILRFPGGSSTARGLKDSIIDRLRERGYGWVDWSANDGDGGSLSSNEEAWGNFTSTINDSIEVILFHDYDSFTTNILPRAIEYLQNNGYELYPLFYESNMIHK